jgi:hypothetical protein
MSSPGIRKRLNPPMRPDGMGQSLEEIAYLRDGVRMGEEEEKREIRIIDCKKP